MKYTRILLFFVLVVLGATAQASDWEIETVDLTGLIPWNYSDMVFTSDGYPHIVFQALTQLISFPYYMEKTCDGWEVPPQRLDDGPETGAWTTMTVEDDGDIHVAWQNIQLRELRYASEDSGWDIHPFEDFNDEGNFNHIFMRQNDQPEIIYADTSNYQIEIVRQNITGVWGEEEVIRNTPVLAIVKDFSVLKYGEQNYGFAYATYQSPDLNVYYALNDDEEELVYSRSENGSLFIKLLGDAQNPIILYLLDGALFFAYRTASWTVEPIMDDLQNKAFDAALDPNGNIWFAAIDLSGALIVGRGDQNGWSSETVDAGSQYKLPAMQILGDLTIAVSYFNPSGPSMKYATSQVSVPTPTVTASPVITPTPSTPTVSPEISPSPTPDQNLPQVTLELNQSVFYPGDMFNLQARIVNSTSIVYYVDLFAMLEVYGLYFFWPEWNQANIGCQSHIHLSPQQFKKFQILKFTWPDDSGSGAATFYAAVMGSESPEDCETEAFYDMDSVTFSWDD